MSTVTVAEHRLCRSEQYAHFSISRRTCAVSYNPIRIYERNVFESDESERVFCAIVVCVPNNLMENNELLFRDQRDVILYTYDNYEISDNETSKYIYKCACLKFGWNEYWELDIWHFKYDAGLLLRKRKYFNWTTYPVRCHMATEYSTYVRLQNR